MNKRTFHRLFALMLCLIICLQSLQVTVFAGDAEDEYARLETDAAGTEIKDNMISAISSFNYSGIAITPEITVADGENTLVEGTDYYVEYSNNVNAGTATVKVFGMLNYFGTATAEFEITKRRVVLTSASDSKIYDGTPLTNGNVSVSGDGFAGEDGATFEVTGSQTNAGYTENLFGYSLNMGTNPQNYDIIVNYGVLDVTAKDISLCTISGVYNASYTGSPITREIKIKDGDRTLAEGKDYSVSYSDNINAGMASVTITGKQNYTGSVTENFEISKAAQLAPDGITATDETNCSANDGTISGLSDSMEIAYEQSDFKPCTSSELTGLAPGIYLIRYTGNSNYSASAETQIIIEKGSCYGGTATCAKQAICEGCHKAYGEINPENHAYNKAEYVWSKSYDVCTAKFTCQNNSKHTEEIKCSVKKEITTEPTCIEQGEYTCTATAQFGGKTYTDIKKYSIPVKEHEWDDFYTVDIEATYDMAGYESIHCKHCTESKDGRSIMPIKEKFEIAKAEASVSLNEFAKEYSGCYSQSVINSAVENINSYAYDESISYESNVQNINAIKEEAEKKVADIYQFIYGCPFISFVIKVFTAIKDMLFVR